MCLYLQLWLLQRSPTWRARAGLPLDEYREDTITAVRVHVRSLLKSYERRPVLSPHWDFAAYLSRGLACLEVEQAAWSSPAVVRRRKANESMFGDW